MKTRMFLGAFCLVVFFGCTEDNPVTAVSQQERTQIETEAILTYRSGVDASSLMCGEVATEALDDMAPVCSTVIGEDGSVSEIPFHMPSSVTDAGWVSDSISYGGSKEMRVGTAHAISARDYSYSDPVIIDPGDGHNQVSAGLLTAGEWHDHDHWVEFANFLTQYPDHYREWSLDVQNRVRIRVVDENDQPVPCAVVRVKRECETVFEGMTLADGSVAFFPPLSSLSSQDHLELKVEKGDRSVRSHITPVEENDQLWTVVFDDAPGKNAPMVDIAFVIDVTGSMSDELQYIQAELLDITERIFAFNIQGLRVALLFYRDRTDEFITRQWDFSSDFQTVSDNLNTMRAGGGGDFPESVNLALKKTVNTMSWSETDAVRVAFLIADAPPHYYQDETYVYSHAAVDAVKKGIKIIPVAASGIDKATEYLFRCLAVKTSGRYIYLTDDSGIGNSHISPDISENNVESLNEILIRTIREEIEAWEQ